jgi:hypothetical protein
VSASKRLYVRDEPGIGGFVVELHLDAQAPPGRHMLDAADIERLRDTKRIVADRAEAIIDVSLTMPPPEMHASPI